MTESHIHETHPDIIKRLRRAEGHLRGTDKLELTG